MKKRTKNLRKKRKRRTKATTVIQTIEFELTTEELIEERNKVSLKLIN